MYTQKILFYLFAAILIFSSLMVISSKKPVRAVLFLVLSFVAAAASWLLIQAEFLAIILVLVYVGAVMVLFLFVVMMLDLNLTPKNERFTSYAPFGLGIALVLAGQIMWILGSNLFGLDAYQSPAPLPADYSNIKALGEVMYTHYVLSFEIAAMLLLVAMIAAVALTFRGPKERKTQTPGQQVQVKKSDRLKIIKYS